MGLEVSRTLRQSPPGCPICDQNMNYFGTADYYVPGIPRMVTSLFSCRCCGTLRRNLSEGQIRSHYDAASYTDPQMEDRFHRQRINFFRSLVSFVTREAGRPPRRCLDFGCSYGHFLRLLSEMDCDTYGIELCQQALDICQHHGLRVYGLLDELDGSGRFDLITLIDSLYYVPDPKALLTDLRERLADDGLLLIRIANRNWIAHLLKNVGRRNHFGNVLGDAIVGYSSSTVDALLRSTGYRVVRTRYWESGKANLGAAKKIFYWLSTVITYASRGSVAISPGIIVLAAKQV